MATYIKILDAIGMGYVPVVKIDGKLFRFEIEHLNKTRIFYRGKHRLFETKLTNVKIYADYKSPIEDDVVHLIKPTKENVDRSQYHTDTLITVH